MITMCTYLKMQKENNLLMFLFENTRKKINFILSTVRNKL